MNRHEIKVRNGYKARDYWWLCTCGDEGGPYELWEFAHDDAVAHSIRGDEVVTP